MSPRRELPVGLDLLLVASWLSVALLGLDPGGAPVVMLGYFLHGMAARGQCSTV